MKNFKKGFTLIELLVVVAILGILMSISMIIFTDYRGKARDTKIQSQLKQVATQVNLYSGAIGEVTSPIFALNIDQFKGYSSDSVKQNIFYTKEPNINSAYGLLSEMPLNTALYYAWDGVHPNLGGKYFIVASSHKGAFCLDFNGNVKSYSFIKGVDMKQDFESNALSLDYGTSYLCK